MRVLRNTKLTPVGKSCPARELKPSAPLSHHLTILSIQAWKEIPAKLLQELDDIKLLLKTDSHALQLTDDTNGLPAIPSALLFVLHVQQLEQGGFTLANGLYRWQKLR